eukprot:7528501-Prorocentrum_lima.AAC.1
MFGAGSGVPTASSVPMPPGMLFSRDLGGREWRKRLFDGGTFKETMMMRQPHSPGLAIRPDASLSLLSPWA